MWNWLLRFLRQSVNVVWTVFQDSAANAAQTLTRAAPGVGKRLAVTEIEVSVKAAAVAAADVLIELKDGATVRWRGVIGAAAARGAVYRKDFREPIVCADNAAANLEVAAAGAGAITTANMAGFTLA